MKKTITLVIIAMMLSLTAVAQTYASLWAQEKAAEGKDLPKTQMKVLCQIEDKAAQEKNYGQMMKAMLKTVRLKTAVSTDSLASAVERIVQKESVEKDDVAKAVLNAVLYRIYKDNAHQMGEGADSMAVRYRKQAMASPEKLAAARAADYEPLVIKGYNASVFGGDMLSVVGYEVEDYKTMLDWYRRTDRRSAACISGLELIRQHRPEERVTVRKSQYIMWLDSLLNIYPDVDVAGEVAIERYEYMSGCPDVTVEDRIGYIHYALDKWGGWQRANYLRNEEKALTAACYRVSMDRSCTEPGRTETVRLAGLRNLSSLTMNVYRAAVDGTYKGTPRNANNYRELKSKLTLLPDKRQTRTYMGHPEYEMYEDSMRLGPLETGVYMLEFQTVPATQTVREMFYVSDVFTMAQPLPGDSVRYVVVNATTGQPLEGAKIRLAEQYRNVISANAVTLTCDADGEVVCKPEKKRMVFAYTPKDKASKEWTLYNSFSTPRDELTSVHTEVFTDRVIYRPGQTVHVAALFYRNYNGIENKAMTKRTVRALMYDANNKVVEEKSLTTDEYGSCSADFVLPVNALNGNFRVEVGDRTAVIRVEEYKRPTFQVEFPKINEKYGNGDTLMVRGKATTYAGVPVQGAAVKYTVRRNTALWWRSCINNGRSGEVIYEGTATTAADGSFTVDVPMILPSDALAGRWPAFYDFVTEADVTDMCGETRSGSMSIPLGSRTTVLTSDMPEEVLGDSLKQIAFNLRNAAGMNISADVRFRIDNGGEWQTVRTGEPYPFAGRLASGCHHLTAVCESDTLEKDFVVFGLDDTVPCVDTRDWFYVSANAFPRDGRPVTVQVGSSDNDVHIVYTIIAGEKVLESGRVDKSNALVNRKFTYKEEYGNGLQLNFAWVKNGKCYEHRAVIARPLPDKRLRMKWTTFRDRLTPGQKEEWSLSVTKPDGTPADAQLMATLYDKSLDQIAAHNWNFVPNTQLSQSYTSWAGQYIYGFSAHGQQTWRFANWRAFDASRFDSSLFPNRYFKGRYYSRAAGLYGAMDSNVKRKLYGARSNDEAAGEVLMANVALKRDSEKKAEAELADVVVATAGAAGDGGSAGETGGQAVQLRENLNETAFFYPSLQADTTGNVTLRFTLPESLTTWRFMGVAHTADMFSGTIEGEAVARKEVMVQPNVPRFIRIGDKAQFSARIFNTGEKVAAGTARLELVDPETEKVVYSQSHAFSVQPDSTVAVTFDYSPDGSHTLLICRITAAGRTFSDGEQHYLPILPDRERVTVTVPFSQNGPGTKTIDISKLMPVKDKTSKLTIEYTDNPAWMMVQALPTLGVPGANNAIEQATALYANTIAASIIKQNPKIKTTFEQWRMERGGETSLMSSLEKNAELKDIVLNETPWMADADREAEQKQLLSGFFNESMLESRCASAVDRLSVLQNQNGSWSWCPGMDGSLYMTVNVAQTLVRLNAMTGKQQRTSAMLGSAFGFMGKKIIERVDEMKKAERQGMKSSFPGTTALQYLYLCALDGRKQSAAVQSACDYLIALLKKDIAGQTIYEKALTAIILAKHGEVQKGREYVKSLKEYTVYTEEQGRYYDTCRAAYSWFDYKIPTEVAAIEAIKTVTPDDTLTIDEMRRWLLQQKRTQIWDTPVNSVDAVYAFLFDNSKELSAREQTVLAIDGRTLDMPQATAGLGYVKTAIAEPKGRTFTATKASEGTSWGALYAQYMQKTSEIETHGSGIKVKKDILLPSKELKVGDRVTVRITVETSRDLDFVQVTDRRAACMEPVGQLSGYRRGAYCSPKDNVTNYFFSRMAKGKHVIETEYYIDRAGVYETGTCSAGCAYAPEYRATAKSHTITVK